VDENGDRERPFTIGHVRIEEKTFAAGVAVLDVAE
jgi:hypothetical protein